LSAAARSKIPFPLKSPAAKALIPDWSPIVLNNEKLPVPLFLRTVMLLLLK
jgi:hypothetical protein